MLRGKSILHVKQEEGRFYSKDAIRGYYNDMTNKVLLSKDYLKSDELPKSSTERGELILFPVAIFQYALGLYDLYLESGDCHYLLKFKQCLDWTLDSQTQEGAWNNFSYIYPDNPYGAMAQGEGVSVLLRGYIEFNDVKYLNAAKSAIDFMLRSVEDGGTADYNDNKLILLEYTHLSPVLNGWIFAIFGLWDYVLVSEDKSYEQKLNLTLSSLKETINKFDNGYWSLYDLSNNIASPFYHILHIALLNVLYDLTGESEYSSYAKLWDSYHYCALNKSRAFVVKAFQKIFH